jgi:hypothetical protein
MNRREALLTTLAAAAGAGVTAKAAEADPPPLFIVFYPPDDYEVELDAKSVHAEWSRACPGVPCPPLLVMPAGGRVEAVVDPRNLPAVKTHIAHTPKVPS